MSLPVKRRKPKKRTPKRKRIPSVRWSEVSYGSMSDPTGEGRQKFADWFSFSNIKGEWFEVQAVVKGGIKGIFRTVDIEEAKTFWRKNRDAVYIQKYNGGLTAGQVQMEPTHIKGPDGRTYTRAYTGPHTRGFAQKVAKGLTEDGLEVIIKQFTKGYYIFVAD